MKTILILIGLSFLTSCAMTPQQRAQLAHGMNKTWHTQEANYQKQQNIHYMYQPVNRTPASPQTRCDNVCRQRKHNMRQQLLYLQMQNYTNSTNGYSGF